MASWAHAVSQGLSAGMKTGADQIGTQIKIDQAAEAEQRAADMKLDTHARLMAMDEAMKARAAERFGSVVKGKMAEPVAATPATVEETGFTRGGAHAAGMPDGMQGSAKEMRALAAKFQAVLDDPAATAEQKTDAQDAIASLDRQAGGQVKANAKDAQGKTRNRSFTEAARAAMEESMMKGIAVPTAMTGMLDSAAKTETEQRRSVMEERKLDSRERIAGAETDRKEKADGMRYEAMMARIEAATGGKDGKKGSSATVQNLEWLRDNLGWSKEQLADYVTEKKHIAPEDIAAKLMAADKMGDLTPEKAMQSAMAIIKARDTIGATAKPATAGIPEPRTWNQQTGKLE